eukprot:ctg_2012.g653
MASRLAAELHAPKVDENDVPGEPSEKAGKQMEGRNGLPYVLLTNEHTKQTAEVYLFGACVTSWKVRDAASEVLFLSDQAVFDRSTAIRGGIPVCFPQFGNQGRHRNGGAAGRVALRAVVTLRRPARGAPPPLPAQVPRSVPGDTEPARTQLRAESHQRGRQPGSQVHRRLAQLLQGAGHRESADLRLRRPGVHGQDRWQHHAARGRRPGQRPGHQPAHRPGVPRGARGDGHFRLDRAVGDETEQAGLPRLHGVESVRQPGQRPGWGGFVCVEPVVFHNEGVTLKPGETWTGSQELAAE